LDWKKDIFDVRTTSLWYKDHYQKILQRVGLNPITISPQFNIEPVIRLRVKAIIQHNSVQE
jgi:hypothetical protein